MRFQVSSIVSSAKGTAVPMKASVCIDFAAVTLSVLGILTPTAGAPVHNAGSSFAALLAALLYDRKYKTSTEKRQ